MIQLLTLSQAMTNGVITTCGGTASQEQVPNPCERQEGERGCPIGGPNPCHFRQTPSDQHYLISAGIRMYGWYVHTCSGIVLEVETICYTGSNGVHILQGTGQLHANRIAACVTDGR